MNAVPLSKKTRSKHNIKPHVFVYAWEKSGTVREVAMRLNVSEKYAQARAARYRSYGIPLKAMRDDDHEERREKRMSLILERLKQIEEFE